MMVSDPARVSLGHSCMAARSRLRHSDSEVLFRGIETTIPLALHTPHSGSKMLLMLEARATLSTSRPRDPVGGMCWERYADVRKRSLTDHAEIHVLATQRKRDSRHRPHPPTRHEVWYRRLAPDAELRHHGRDRQQGRHAPRHDRPPGRWRPEVHGRVCTKGGWTSSECVLRGVTH